MHRKKAITAQPLHYEADETAWLEQTAALISQGRFAEVDQAQLCEYLLDMARRDRREVFSRLIILLAHRLKWDYQPEKRTKSWQRTMLIQRTELEQLLESAVLRQHAEDVFLRAYEKARERAAVETELSSAQFPDEPPWSLATLLETAAT